MSVNQCHGGKGLCEKIIFAELVVELPACFRIGMLIIVLTGSR